MSISLNVRVICLSFLLLFMLPVIASAETASSEEFAFKIAVESHMENRLNAVLSEMAGTDDIMVIVNADVKTDVGVVKKVRTKAKQRNSLVLPGVPIKKELGKEKTSSTTTPDLPGMPALVNRLEVTILVDDDVPETLTEIAHDVAIAVIGYDPDRGDKLSIKRFKFGSPGFEWSSLGHPPHLYWLITILVGGFFLVAAAIFFLNPFKKLSGTLQDIDWSSVFRPSRSEGSNTVVSSISHVASNTGASLHNPKIEVNEQTATGKPKPFDFIKEEHLPELAFLLKEEAPQDIAILANYLRPELTTRLMELIPQETVTEAALHLSSVQLADPAQVERFETSLRERLDFVVGGGDKVASILSLIPEHVREHVFQTLEDKNAEAAERIRQRIKTFESIIRTAQPVALQVLFQHFDATTFARILKSMPGDIQSKVLESLSEGASEMLREEMELSRPFGQARLRKEKLNVVTTYRRLVTAGLIEEDEG